MLYLLNGFLQIVTCTKDIETRDDETSYSMAGSLWDNPAACLSCPYGLNHLAFSGQRFALRFFGHVDDTVGPSAVSVAATIGLTTSTIATVALAGTAAHTAAACAHSDHGKSFAQKDCSVGAVTIESASWLVLDGEDDSSSRDPGEGGSI